MKCLKQVELRDSLDIRDHGEKGSKETTPRMILCETG